VAGRVPSSPIGLYGGGLISRLDKLPADIELNASVTFPLNPGVPPPPVAVDPKSAQPGLASTQAPQQASQPGPVTFSNTYQDEGLQHWDVSIGVPVNAISALSYSSTDGVVSTKQVSRLNAYGLFDIYPWATDVGNPPAFGYPHIVLGLPLSGQVFNKPFFGAGGVVGFQSLPWIGKFLNTAIPLRLNFYGGVVYNKEFRPATLSVGSPASPAAVSNDLRGVRVWKGQFGIEFSITDVASKLKAATSKNSNTSSPTTKGN